MFSVNVGSVDIFVGNSRNNQPFGFTLVFHYVAHGYH